MSGRLVDDEGMPMAGARVWLMAARSLLDLQASDFLAGPSVQVEEVSTDVDGRFEFRSLRWPGRYLSLLARKADHAELRLEGMVPIDGCELDIGIRVLHRGRHLTVQFVDPLGAPVEGVGLARIWSAGGNWWRYYPEWHGVSGPDGLVHTREVPGPRQLGEEPADYSALIPGQYCRWLAYESLEFEGGKLTRFVLPPRRWIEGRIEGLPAGRRFAVSTGGARGLLADSTWVLHQYPNGHPMRGNRAPLVETDGAFRLPTWTGAGDPATKTQVVVHVQLEDGSWQPVHAHEIPFDEAEKLQEHDATYPPIVVRVPPLVRVELPSHRHPAAAFRLIVRAGARHEGALVFPEPFTEGEFFVAVPGLDASTHEITLASFNFGFADYEESHALRTQDGFFDAGPMQLQRSVPIPVRFTNVETGEPIAGVIWTHREEYAFDCLLASGTSDSRGITTMGLSSSLAELRVMPPAGFELSEWLEPPSVDAPGAGGLLDVPLDRLDQQRVALTDQRGQPLPGWLVETAWFPALTDEGGEATVFGRPDEHGDWAITVYSAEVAAGVSSYEALGGDGPHYGFDGAVATSLLARIVVDAAN